MPASEHPALVPALQATVHRVLDALSRELRSLGLTQAEINALAQFEARWPLTVAELQRATGQRRSTLTGILDRLEEKGLARRELNPADRRSFSIVLTRDGERAARRVRAAFAGLEQSALAELRASSRNGFFEVLASLDRATGSDRR